MTQIETKDDGTPAMTARKWLTTLLRGKPHFIIGGAADPYLLRWFLIPRNHWCNVYLHKFLRDDDDRALHDHPWAFVSVMLRGQYIEHLDRNHWCRWRWIERRSPSVVYRAAEHRHRVELFKRQDGTPIPCWTLVITGRNSRTWGFWCPKGFVPWFRFVNRDDPGSVGPGCGD